MEAELRRLVADVLDVSPDELTDATGPGEVEGWDSLATLEILAGVEERFAVKIELEELIELATLGDWKQCLRRKLEAGA